MTSFASTESKKTSWKLEVKQSLEQLLELPQKVEQIKHDVEILKLQHKDQQESLEQVRQQMADLSSNSVKREERAKLRTFFGALDRNEYILQAG